MEPKEMVDITPLERLIDEIGAKSVFGTPTKENDVVIIPVAQVEYGFGYGSGYGSELDDDEAPARQDAATSGPGSGGGAGGGAGGGGRATPRGYIRITPESVTYEPINDNERLPLAGIFLVAWLVFWTMLTIRTLIKAVERIKARRYAA